MGPFKFSVRLLPSTLYRNMPETVTRLDSVYIRKIGIWNQRTLLEKLLLGLLLFCLFGFLTVVLILVFDKAGFSNKDSKPKYLMTKDGHEICASHGCVMAAHNLLSAIDNTGNPCDDFYKFACGRWNDDHPIPDDMAGYGTFAYVRERVRQQMRVLLESEDDSNHNSQSIKMAKLSYRGCMNETQLDELKSSKLLSALEELEYWPVIHDEKWREGRFHLTNLLNSVRVKYGNEVFFSLYVYADAQNTSQNVLYIDQGTLALGRGARDYYLNQTMFGKQMHAYYVYMFQVVKVLGEEAGLVFADDKTAKQITKDLTDIMQFERDMAQIIVPEADRRNHTRMYNKRTIRDLTQMMPHVDWLNHFHGIMPKDVEQYVTLDSPIIVCELDYMKDISQLINKTSKRVLTNYVLWRFTQAWVKLLDHRFDDIKQDFLRVMTGQMQKSMRWKECVPGPVSWLPLATGSLYVRRHFKAKDKHEALQMISHLRDSFIKLVKQLVWMDPATKETAIEKANRMLSHIGYPDFVIDDEKLDKHYEGLEILEDDVYFDMVRKVVGWTQEKEFRRLSKIFDKTEFEVSPAIVNAFYSPEKNAITFPAGILQPPFFSGDYPKSVNYGAIGAVIGHEITHGFDDQGSQFDKDGNLHNWWHEEALKGFAERKQCIIAQYDSYKEPKADMFVNGKLTQGENIADNGGVKESFRAYRKYVEEIGKEEPRLPGLTQYSNNQIFFLSYAHFWCGHKKKAAAIQQILTDEHSPEIFRVIGVLSNLDDFSKAFNCSKGSRLNPFKTDNSKCIVW